MRTARAYYVGRLRDGFAFVVVFLFPHYWGNRIYRLAQLTLLRFLFQLR